MDKFKKETINRGSLLIAIAFLVSSFSATALGSAHVVIITDLNGTHNDTAYFDVSSDPPSQVSFAVFPSAGVPILVDMNANNFAMSPELFGIASARNALVIASTANSQVESTAELRQQKLVMQVPTMTSTLGTVFGFPLGDLGTGAYLLLGNPSGFAALGTLAYGPSIAPSAAQVNVPGWGIQVIQLTQSATRVWVTINNNIPVIAQLLVNGHGQEFSMSIIPPCQ